MKKKCSIILILWLLQLITLPQIMAQEIKIKIITTTDVHGGIAPYDFIENQNLNYSLAQVHTYIKKQRADSSQTVILLDNGDILQGQPIVYYYNFEKTDGTHILADVMNFMQYDAGTVGNHDIETGHPVYDKLVKQFNFPWMAANAVDSVTQKPYFKPYTVFTIDTIKVAVLSLITPAIPLWLPQNIWSGMYFEDMVQSAKKWVEIIKNQEQPHILIGLFHAGLDYNYNGQTEETWKNENGTKLIAEKVAGFDIIFAGHDHQSYNSTISNYLSKSVLVLDGKSGAKMVSEVTIVLKNNNGVLEKKISGKLVEMSDFEADSEFMTKFSPAFQEVKDYITQPIGTFTKSINTRDALFGPSEFTDLIHTFQLSITQADISFASPLSFNAEIKQGTVFVRDMFKLYRFENLLYTMQLSGKEIKDYLEFSYGNWFNEMYSENDHLLMFETNLYGDSILKTPYYNYSSAAGINYFVDISKPIGQRVTITSLTNGSEFKEADLYTVAVNSYRGNGGGGHLTEGSGIPQDKLAERIITSTELDLRFYLMKWIKEKQEITPVPLNNWHVVPENYWKKGKERDFRILFNWQY